MAKLEKENLEIGQIVDIKYRTVGMGDKLRWFYNLKVTGIGNDITIDTVRGSVTFKYIHFEQLQKNGRVKKFHLTNNDIYTIILH